MKSEQALIERARQGDRDAFGQLVRQCQDRLFTSMVHLVGAPDQAEDITQDALVQAYVKLDSFHGDSSFYTWVYRIALRLAVDQHRKRKPYQSIDWSRQAAGDEPIDPGEAPSTRLQRLERAEQVRRALTQLSDEFRQILVLREIDDFDYATIAKLLEISVGTVRSRLYRARAAMRAALERMIHEERHEQS